MASLVLYAVAGLFWVPVIFMQMEMRDLAREAGCEGSSAAAALFCAVPPLVPVRHSRLWIGHGHSLADDRKTVLGGPHERGTHSQHPRARRIRPDRPLRHRRSARAGFSRGRRRAKPFGLAALERARSRIARDVDGRGMRWRGCCAIMPPMSWSIASACCRTGPAATPARCIAISWQSCCRRSATRGRAIRLVHISIPGAANEDRTAFSQTKREAERLIAASGIAYAILRPGFVVAPSAYGGSAMLRALAAFPIDLPAAESATPFQPVAASDIAATIAWLAARDAGEAGAVSWDLMQPEAGQSWRRDRAVSPRARHRGHAAHRAAVVPARSRRQTRRSRKSSRLDAADAHHRDCRIAPRRHRRSRQLDGRHRHRAENHRGDGWPTLRHHSGQMVFAAVPGQGARHRQPCPVLDGVRLHLAGDLL